MKTLEKAIVCRLSEVVGRIQSLENATFIIGNNICDTLEGFRQHSGAQGKTSADARKEMGEKICESISCNTSGEHAAIDVPDMQDNDRNAAKVRFPIFPVHI